MTKKSITYGGYQFEADMECFDDVRFFEIADKLEKEPVLHVDILKMAIGEDGYKAFSDYFTKKDGRLKMSAVIGAVGMIFEASDPKGSASGISESTTKKN